MKANETRRFESDGSTADRTLDSWQEVSFGDELQYVGEHSGTWWLTDCSITFKHGYANSDRVRITDVGGFPHDIAEPASDFVPVATEVEA